MNRVQVQRFLFRLLLSIVCISGGYTQHCTVRKTLVDGQVTIATLLRLHKASGGGGKCGQISRTDFQTLEAIRWAVSKLNGDNSNSSFIPGIQIGTYTSIGKIGHRILFIIFYCYCMTS